MKSGTHGELCFAEVEANLTFELDKEEPYAFNCD